jgi:hypothetical protein
MVSMAVFCAHSIDWDLSQQPNSPTVLPMQSVIMPYTQEEELWIKDQFEQESI